MRTVVESSPFRFNSMKAVQAAGVVLREEPGHRINYMKLLKLLYIAERESLRLTGRMITGDLVCAMPRGPVLSSVLNLINGRHSGVAFWDEHIERERYHVSLKSNPGVTALSPLEVELLQKATHEHRDNDEWEMVEIMHEFDEWKKNNPGKSSKPIPIRDILNSVGRGGEADELIREAAAQTRMDGIFARQEACSAATRTNLQTQS